MPDTSHTPVEQPKLPSADLIAFRFDRIDDAVEKLDKKVEYFTQTFITKDEAQLMLAERNEKIATLQRETAEAIKQVRTESASSLQAIKDRLDQHDADKKWLNRAVIGAILSAVFFSVGSLIIALLSRSR